MPQALYPPRILALISHLSFSGQPSKFSQAVREILPRYQPHALVDIVETSVDELLPTARRLEREQAVDIFICSGASADFLRQHITTTVLSIRMGEYDLIRALNLARERGTKVGILSHLRPHTELREMASLFTVEIQEAVYTSLEDARQKIRQLVSAGYHIIVGSPTAVELAEEAGAKGISAFNADAVRRAMDDALAICQSRQREKLQHQRISTVLQHLTEGVIALDRHGNIQSINPSMSQLLDIGGHTVIGTHIQQVLPDLPVTPVLETGVGEENILIPVGQRKLAASIMPVFEDGKVDGAVIACQEIRAIQRAERRIRSQARPQHFIAKYTFNQLLGEAPAFRQAIELAHLYSNTASTVLIAGESGTGKELIAQSIHNASPRRQGPFVAINCAAFPETLLESELFGYEEGAFTGTRKGGKSGLFEAAHTGTIFLDEIGDMPVSLQTRLLRVLQEREVLRLGSAEPVPINIRVIAATHHDLRSRISKGLFREDLFYRLNILRVALPPLRKRLNDIPPIARALADNLTQEDASQREAASRLLEQMMPHLLAHDWPGNIRELENIVERACLAARLLEEEAQLETSLTNLFPELFDQPPSGEQEPEQPKQSLQAVSLATEIAHIRQTLDACGGDMTETARRLGISRSTLWRRLRRNT